MLVAIEVVTWIVYVVVIIALAFSVACKMLAVPGSAERYRLANLSIVLAALAAIIAVALAVSESTARRPMGSAICAAMTLYWLCILFVLQTQDDNWFNDQYQRIERSAKRTRRRLVAAMRLSPSHLTPSS